MKERNEIDRLGLAARAEATKVALSGARIPLTILSIVTVLLAFIAESSFNEMLAARVLAVLIVVTTILVWRASRFAAYAIAVLCFVILITSWIPFGDPDARTPLGSATRAMISAIILFIGYRWWTNGMPFIAAQSEKLGNERAKVAEWSRALKSSNESHPFVEFSTQSFIRGNWTYRLLNTGSCWAIAKFKSGKMERLLGFRILELNAVHAIAKPTGNLDVEMANLRIQGVEISNEMRDRLLNLAGANR